MDYFRSLWRDPLASKNHFAHRDLGARMFQNMLTPSQLGWALLGWCLLCTRYLVSIPANTQQQGLEGQVLLVDMGSAEPPCGSRSSQAHWGSLRTPMLTSPPQTLRVHLFCLTELGHNSEVRPVLGLLLLQVTHSSSSWDLLSGPMVVSVTVSDLLFFLPWPLVSLLPQW